jgi:hypothetical protein
MILSALHQFEGDKACGRRTLGTVVSIRWCSMSDETIFLENTRDIQYLSNLRSNRNPHGVTVSTPKPQNRVPPRTVPIVRTRLTISLAFDRTHQRKLNHRR